MEGRNEPIVLDTSLITGVKEIDKQHQILINMIYDANNRLGDSNSREVLEEIIHDLMSYAIYHFDTEEELMLDNQYDEEAKEQHFKEHRAFSSKVSTVQEEVREGKLIPRDDLISFLNGWLINHILNTDQKLGKFLTHKNG